MLRATLDNLFPALDDCEDLPIVPQQSVTEDEPATLDCFSLPVCWGAV